MSRGPVASQLCLLSSLKDYHLGDKVRFLGCVTAYQMQTASLSLGHMYPPGSNSGAVVNIELVLETIQPELTHVGEWVNVIGYITSTPKRTGMKTHKSKSLQMPVQVQALLVWSAGSLDLKKYEESFEVSATVR